MLKNRLVKTENLNQAALLTTLGAELVGVTKTYPSNMFVLEASPLALWWERHVGVVPYRKFCNQRVRLKQKGRQLAGLPKKFTGKNRGYQFGEIAMVKSWNKKEKEKYGVDNNG